MHDVAILGAGELGGMCAHVLARRDLVRTIRLVDVAGQVAAGKALDIMQSAPCEGFSTRVSGSSDLAMAVGASVIVVADRVAGGEWNGGEGLLTLKQISRFAARSVVLCAGASQRELIEQGVRELGCPRSRVLGTAPEALAAALRALVALEHNVSARDVSLTVLGVPPHHTVVPWEEVTIGGFAAVTVMDEPTRRRLVARVAPLWPPGPYALAHAAADAVACLTGRSHRLLSCFVAPDATAGRRTRAAALPARLGTEGLMNVELPRLSGSTRVALDNAMLL